MSPCVIQPEEEPSTSDHGWKTKGKAEHQREGADTPAHFVVLPVTFNRNGDLDCERFYAVIGLSGYYSLIRPLKPQLD